MSIKHPLASLKTSLAKEEVAQPLAALESFSKSNPELHLDSQLSAIREEYGLMVDFWRRGYADGQRGEIHKKLAGKTLRALIDAQVRHANVHEPYLRFLAKRGTDGILTADYVDSLRAHLEKHVADLALLGLEQSEGNLDKLKSLYASHEKRMSDVFDTLVVSCTWSGGVADAMRDLLLSPTVESLDQQLLVSALTLACLNVSDPSKFRVLLEVSLRSEDMPVRQRALVGVALTTPTVCEWALEPALCALDDVLAHDERFAREFMELQLQAVYCLSSDKDVRTIEEKFMPSIHSFFRRHGSKLSEQEDIEGISDVMESEMEEMENMFQKVQDLQSAGADVFFAPFAKAKDFPFFNSLANWFMPFHADHTAVMDGMRGELGEWMRKFLDTYPLCNSDKYSFMLMFAKKSETEMKAISAMTKAMPGEMLSDVLRKKRLLPAHVRRTYMQDLCRFFRLFPSRQCFSNPFEGTPGQLAAIFTPRDVYAHSAVQEASRLLELASLLVKKEFYDHAVWVLERVKAETGEEKYTYGMLCGAMAKRQKKVKGCGKASAFFAMALEARPGDRRAHVALARAQFAEGEMAASASTFADLARLYPDNLDYALGHGVCLVGDGHYAEAEPLLYKLFYEAPEKLDVKRALVHALLGNGKAGQALKYCDELCALKEDEGGNAEDDVLLGICLWSLRRIADASLAFARYMHTLGLKGQEKAAARGEFFDKDVIEAEKILLDALGISRLERQLMRGEVCSQD